MSTYNIGIYKEISKIIPELSSNMCLISSSVTFKDRIFMPGGSGLQL